MTTPDEEAREEDLAFLETLREGSLEDIERLALNLRFGGPRWQIEAVERALAKRKESA